MAQATGISLATAALALSACATLPPAYQATPGTLALPNLVVYQDSSGPLSYHAPAAVLSPLASGRVQGRACQSGLQLPIGLLFGLRESGGDQATAAAALSAGWGEGGWRAALTDAAAKAPAGATLYDLRADLGIFMVLGIWREQCLVVSAAVAAAPAGDEAGKPKPDGLSP